MEIKKVVWDKDISDEPKDIATFLKSKGKFKKFVPQILSLFRDLKSNFEILDFLEVTKAFLIFNQFKFVKKLLKKTFKYLLNTFKLMQIIKISKFNLKYTHKY